MGVGISRALLAAILADCAVDPAVERCGLLFGTDAAIAAVRPCANVAAAPARRFELDPAALIAALRAERAGGPRLVGHYHSHPDGQAMPSATDAAAAAPDGRLWLIVAGGGVRAWRSVTDRQDGALRHGRFAAVDLVVEEPPPMLAPAGRGS